MHTNTKWWNFSTYEKKWSKYPIFLLTIVVKSSVYRWVSRRSIIQQASKSCRDVDTGRTRLWYARQQGSYASQVYRGDPNNILLQYTVTQPIKCTRLIPLQKDHGVKFMPPVLRCWRVEAGFRTKLIQHRNTTHWLFLAFACVRMWDLRLVDWANFLLQPSNGQTYGRSPVWIRTCVRRLKSREKRFPQPSNVH